MVSAAYRHIFDRPCRNLFRVYDLEFLDAPLLQFSSHDLRKRAHLCLVYICNLELTSVKLVSRTHAADDRNVLLLTLHDKSDLGCHGVHRVDHIVVAVPRKVVRVLRKKETFVDLYIHLRVDIKHPVPHNIGLVLSHCASGRYDLSVEICQTHLVIIYQIKCSDTASDQRLAYITANSAYSKYRYLRACQLVHGFLAK